MKVITNLVPRDLIDGFQLTAKEREQFDYLDWDKIESGNDSASFFRYKGELYDLGTFMRGEDIDDDSVPEVKRHWDGFFADSFFSGLAVRFTDDYEGVVVALMTW